MPNKPLSNENPLTGEGNIFVCFAAFYSLCIVLLLFPTSLEGVWDIQTEWVARINESSTALLAAIAGACTLLIIIAKNITDGPTKSTTKLILELNVGLAAFSAAFRPVQEGNLSSQQGLFSQMAPDIALIILAVPVLYSARLWMRCLYPDLQDSAIKIYANGIIWGLPGVGWLVGCVFATGVVWHIFPGIGTLGILIIFIVILPLPIVAWFIRRSSVSLRSLTLFLPSLITKISSVLGGFPLRLVHTAIALLMMIGGILFGLWIVTLINDPTCSASPEVAGGATRILKVIAFCWLG